MTCCLKTTSVAPRQICHDVDITFYNLTFSETFFLVNTQEIIYIFLVLSQNLGNNPHDYKQYKSYIKTQTINHMRNFKGNFTISLCSLTTILLRPYNFSLNNQNPGLMWSLSQYPLTISTKIKIVKTHVANYKYQIKTLTKLQGPIVIKLSSKKVI